MPASAKARRCARPSLWQYSANKTYKWTIYLFEPRPSDAPGTVYGNIVQRQPANEQSICLSQCQAMCLASLTAIQCKQNLQMNNLFASAKARWCARPSLWQYNANKTYKWTIYLPQPRPSNAPSSAYGNTVQRQPANEQSICLSQV